MTAAPSPAETKRRMRGDDRRHQRFAALGDGGDLVLREQPATDDVAIAIEPGPLVVSPLLALMRDQLTAAAPTKTQLSLGKQPVDDHVAARHAVVDQFGFALRANDKQRRQFALRDAFRKFHEHTGAVIERPQWPPVGPVALDPLLAPCGARIERLQFICSLLLQGALVAERAPI